MLALSRNPPHKEKPALRDNKGLAGGANIGTGWEVGTGRSRNSRWNTVGSHSLAKGR